MSWKMLENDGLSIKRVSKTSVKKLAFFKEEFKESCCMSKNDSVFFSLMKMKKKANFSMFLSQILTIMFLNFIFV